MRRDEVESAIAKLDRLLELDSEIEEDYQQWLEQNPVVFLSLGYTGSLSQPRLRATDGSMYIPDFLVQRPNSAWEIFEIKTPQASILRDRDRRSTFYATFEQYLSQCHEYAEAIDESQTRENVQREYGIRLNKRPATTLVSGRSEGLNQEKLLNLSGRRTPPITVFTFDDLRTALEAYRTFNFGKYDSAQGFSLYTELKVHRSEPRFVNNHLFDLGIQQDRDRASVFINGNGYLRLDLWDSSGHKHEVRSSEPLAPVDYDVLRFLEVEAGIGEDFGFMSIALEGRYRADIRIEAFPFSLSSEYVLGSDWSTKRPSWFSAKEIMVYGRPLTFEDKLRQRRYVLSRRENPGAGPVVVFRGNKFMYTEGHPAATRAGAGA